MHNPGCEHWHRPAEVRFQLCCPFPLWGNSLLSSPFFEDPAGSFLPEPQEQRNSIPVLPSSLCALSKPPYFHLRSGCQYHQIDGSIKWNGKSLSSGSSPRLCLSSHSEVNQSKPTDLLLGTVFFWHLLQVAGKAVNSSLWVWGAAGSWLFVLQLSVGRLCKHGFFFRSQTEFLALSCLNQWCFYSVNSSWLAPWMSVSLDGISGPG